MRRSSMINVLGATTALVVAAAGRAEARVDVEIDKIAQKMSVYQNGTLRYVWPAAMYRDGNSVPDGVYAPERLERSPATRGRDNAGMPNAIFFRGYAIHGSDGAKYGEPACQGCVRLHRGDAALLYSLVKEEGPGNTVIYVSGDGPRPYGGDAVPRPGPDGGMGWGRPPAAPPGRPYAGGEPSAAPPYAPGRPADWRAPYRPGPDAGGERWGEERAASRLRLPPDYVDPYQDGRGVPRTPAEYQRGDRRNGVRGPGPDYDYGEPWGDERAARGPRLPPDYVDPYRDEASRVPRPPAYIDPYRDARGPRLPPDYVDPYREDAWHGRRPPGYVDPYREGRAAPRGPGGPDYPDRYGDRREYADRWQDGRFAPRGPGAPPDYRGDGYGRPPDFRGPPDGGPYGEPPEGPYGPRDAGPYPPDRRGGGRSADVRDAPRTQPYRAPDGRSEGAPRGGQPMPRGNAAGRVPADTGRANNGRADVWRNDSRPPPWPQPQGPVPWPPQEPLPRSQDRSQMQAPPAPTVASGPPPLEGAAPPDIGYRVLPQSYWRGSSWRWRPGGDPGADDDRAPPQQ